jgi:hypothetical protein
VEGTATWRACLDVCESEPQAFAGVAQSKRLIILVLLLCCRVAHCLNVLVTSHTAQLASAATAHLLSSLLRPVDPVAAWQLCAQQQQPRLRSASCAGAVRLRVHAEVHQEAAGLEAVLR